MEDAILKLPRLIHKSDTYNAYEYKQHTINIHKPREGTEKMCIVWTPLSATFQISSSDSNQMLLELAVHWIDRSLANKNKNKKKKKTK